MNLNGLPPQIVGDPVGAVPAEVFDILLVEDDAGDALLVEEFLLDSGLTAEVRWVRSLAEATRPPAVEPDCVLLDLHLPDGHGLEALRQMLDVTSNAAVLVLTGLADTGVGMAAVAAGAQDYLVKGQVDGPSLGRAIRYAVQRKQAEHTARMLRESTLRAEENTRLERGLLPTPMVKDPSLRVTARYRAGRQRALLGGDFYDVVQTDDGVVHAVIGDVCGHGPDEAALGVCLRIAWRALVLSGQSGAVLLELLEQVLIAERADDEIFATVCTLAMELDGGSAQVACAGHPPPLVVTEGRAEPLAVEPALPLGMLAGPGEWAVQRIALPSTADLLLYTDGLIEGHIGPGPDRLGIEGLTGLVSSLLSVTERHGLVDAVVDAVQSADTGRNEDDLAVIHLMRKSS